MSNDAMSVDRQHYLIVPSDPVQFQITEKIEKACRNKLISDYKIRLSSGYMTTIACVYVESLIRTLVKVMRTNKGDGSINFLDLFTISSNNRENDDADKDGNINIIFTPGSIAKEIMDRDYSPVVTEDMWKDTIIEAVESECAKILASKHKMTSNSKANWTKITFVYMEYLFRTLKLMAKVANENGNSAVMINFLEMFEAHCTVDTVTNPENPELVSETYNLKIRPGFEAKLLIKDDGITEMSDDDEE
jgi:hypothetical protein